MAEKIVGVLESTYEDEPRSVHSTEEATRRTTTKATSTRGIQVSPDELVQRPGEIRTPAVESSAPVALPELLRVLRDEHDQVQRRLDVAEKLQQSQVAIATATRLLTVVPAVQRTLGECIRFDDKANFVHLYDTLEDCFENAFSSFHFTPDQDVGTARDNSESTASFLDALPDEIKDCVLDFLSKIRYDSDFLHASLVALSYRDIIKLLPERSLSTESIFGSSQQFGTHAVGQLDRSTEDQIRGLQLGGFGSPLETLIHAMRSPSMVSVKDDDIATDVWATVCAKLIMNQKPGSEKLVPAIITIWASASGWPGKDRLELWILRTFQEGGFLLRRPHHQKKTFQMHMQDKQEPKSKDGSILEEFYGRAVDSLLDLLGDSSGPSLIPDGARKMCATICAKLSSSPGYKNAFPSFVGTRWLVPSFLPDAVTLPEMHGIAEDLHISHSARQLILREITSRTQKALLDSIYSWRKLGTPPSPDLTRRVSLVLSKLGTDRTLEARAIDTEYTKDESSSGRQASVYVASSAIDTVTMIDALYPQRRRSSVTSESSLQSRLGPRSSIGLRSSTSSMSGFSLFQGAEPSPSSTAIDLSTHDDARAEPNGGATPHASADSILAADELTARLHQNEQRLHDVRHVIEDSVATDNHKEVSEWAILVPGANRVLRSIRDHFAEIVRADGINSSGQSIRSSIYASCKAAIEHMLEAMQEEKYSGAIMSTPFWSNDGGYSCAHLTRAFEACRKVAEEQFDFLAAHAWSQRATAVATLATNEDAAFPLGAIINEIASDATHSQHRSRRLADLCEGWLAMLRPMSESRFATIGACEKYVQLLRSKMWYVADVRGSSAYEEVRNIASALYVMGQPQSLQTPEQAPLRNWSSNRIISSELFQMTETQVIDLISARPRHGGRNKLADDQVRALQTWMTKNRIEKLCKGEERVHKLCMDIQKCIDTLLADIPQDKSALWSNVLFRRELKAREEPKRVPRWSSPVANGSTASLRGIRVQQSNESVDNLSIRSRPLSPGSSKDYFHSQSPSWTTKSSGPFWSPAVTDGRSSSSATSIAPSRTESMISRRRRKIRSIANHSKVNDTASLSELLRQHLTTLLLSDLAGSFFNDGSETDRSYWTGIGGHFAEKHLRAILAASGSVGNDDSAKGFGYRHAFQTLLQRFSMTWSPFAKIKYLHEMDALLQLQVGRSKNNGFNVDGEPSPVLAPGPAKFAVAPDNPIGGFRRVFADSSMRPPHIFRDLQLIAALVPGNTLDYTPQGRAFWNAVVGLTALQQEARKVMVETADKIILYHANNRYAQTSSTASSPAQQQRDDTAFTSRSARSSPSSAEKEEDISRYSMSDAGTLLQIAAKEGDPVAQRELATMYLTHPELLPRIILPFAMPRSVFTEALEAKWRRNQDPQRCDPATMCVAHHWMVLSSRGGDALAKEYLRQGEEMEKLP